MKRRKFILITFFSSSSLILSSCFKPSPAKTVKKFMGLIEKGEVNEAMTLLSGNVTQFLGEEKTRLTLYKGTKSIQKKGGIKSYKVNDEIVTGDFATVKLTLIFKDETKDNIETKLIKKDGEWKINLEK